MDQEIKINPETGETGCCPKFDPAKWDEKEHIWNERPFIKESIPQIFHMPLIPSMIGTKITKLWDAANRDQKVEENKNDTLILFYDPTPFKSEIYLSVTGEVSGVENVKLSGTYISKVYDGGYNAIPTFIKEMEQYLESIGKKAEKYYIHYAYCPKCAKAYGNNYMIFFAKVA